MCMYVHGQSHKMDQCFRPDSIVDLGFNGRTDSLLNLQAFFKDVDLQTLRTVLPLAGPEFLQALANIDASTFPPGKCDVAKGLQTLRPGISHFDSLTFILEGLVPHYRDLFYFWDQCANLEKRIGFKLKVYINV